MGGGGNTLSTTIGFTSQQTLSNNNKPHSTTTTKNLSAKYSLVFNGEIYNFVELRDELIAKGYVFYTNSDSEVLLACYDCYGSACLNRFNGMWAFAIFNHETNELFLSRDRFGKKPLFYAFVTNEKNEKSFVFASEMKAIYPFLKEIKPSKQFSRMADISSVFEYEQTEHTLVHGIKRFPHAHFTTINLSSVQEGKQELQPIRYYHILDNLPYNPAKPKPYSDIVAEFRALFLDSVSLRMRADVPLGTALSGGVDSSATICAMSHISKNIQSQQRQNDWQHACIACFKDTPLDESEYAKMVCDYIGIQGEFLEINPLAHWDKIEEYFYLFEDLYITSPVPMIAIYGAIKQRGVTVTLDGHGADELFSGYGQLINALWDSRYNIKRIKEILHTLNDTREEPKSHRALYKEGAKFLFKNFKNHIRKKQYMPTDSHINFQQLDYTSKWLYELFDQTVLPTLLRNYDRYSMINSVEVRMPFLDHRLVELVFSLPYTYKIRNGFTKALIRDALHDIMPESVIWRKSKMGFSSPIIQWMQRDKSENGLKEWFLDIVHAKDFLECPLVPNPKEIQKLAVQICNKEKNTYNDGDRIWCGINPYLWQKSLAFAR